MPRSSTGKWVARAGATGGGRTYRGQAPINWYLVLVLIVIAGLVSIAFARIDYQRGAAANTIPPVKGGAPWFAAITFDVCGTQRAPLPSNASNTATQSFYTTGNGVITISPKTTGDAGHNAVLGKFVSSYKGLALSATTLRLPAASSASSKTSKKGKTGSSATTYRNGQRCPPGSRDAGKKAYVTVSYWPNAFSSASKASTVHGNPATLRFTDDQLITVGFVPAGTKLPKPNGAIVTALLDASTGSASTTTPTSPPATTTPTTAPATTTPTTARGSTSSTAPASSTTGTTTGSTTATTTPTTKAG
jgi:hypothetical protein